MALHQGSPGQIGAAPSWSVGCEEAHSFSGADAFTGFRADRHQPEGTLQVHTLVQKTGRFAVAELGYHARMNRLGSVLLWVLIFAGATPSPTSAQAGAAERYREVVTEAIEAFARQDFSGAQQLFEQAHRLAPSARTLRTLGMVAFELRQYETALTYLRASLDDTRRKLADAHRAGVEDLIERTETFLGKLVLTVVPPGAEVRIDGAPANWHGDELWLHTGVRSVSVEAPGHQPFGKDIEVHGNERIRLHVTLEQDLGSSATAASGGAGSQRADARPNPAEASPDSVPAVAAASPGDAPREDVATPEDAAAAHREPAVVPMPRPEATTDGPNLLPWVAMGIGGAMLAGTLITGPMALAAESDLDTLCPAGRECAGPDGRRAGELRDEGERLTLLTDVLLLGGIAVAGAGFAYFLFDGDGTTEVARISLACLPGTCVGNLHTTF